jgi:hypothetical protein
MALGYDTNGNFLPSQQLVDKIDEYRAALLRALEDINNKKVPRQNIGGPIRATLMKD